MSALPATPTNGTTQLVGTPGREHPSSRTAGRVLYIGDDPAQAQLTCGLLAEQSGLDDGILVGNSLTAGLALLNRWSDIVCVLLDLGLPDAATLEGIHRIAALDQPPPVIVLTGDAAATGWPAALRAGAEDFLLKDRLDGERLERAIRYAIERRESRRQLVDREIFIRSVLDALHAPTAVIDPSGRIVNVNRAWEQMATDGGGEPRWSGVGSDYLAVCDAAGARDGSVSAPEAAAAIRDVLAGRRKVVEVDYDCSTPTQERWFTMQVSALPRAHAGAVVFHFPVTRLKQKTTALEHLALHDALTDLPNRTYLVRELEAALQDTSARGDVGVLVCDLDDFKVVNDGLGHEAGDRALIQCAHRLRTHVRDRDLVARLSGDEFVVLLHDATPAVIDRLARRLVEALGEPIVLKGGEIVSLGASVGIAIGTPGTDARAVLRDADAAMYRAKELGRRRIAWFNGELRASVLDRLALRRDLRAGLREQELFCVHQPEVHLADGRLFGFESLVRWQHPRRGLLSPDRFVPIIEQLGAADALFDHVLTETMATQRQWARELGWTPSVSVNLSARQLEDERVAETVARAVATAGCDPATLWLEVTETAVADAPSLDAFEALHGLGVRLAIDDFGTGWSSMARLSGFPWDLLKIDRSFVAPLGTSDRADRVVESIVAMAHALDILVVAEGVETPRQLQILADMGCDIAQGYLIAKPTDAASAVCGLSGSGQWQPWPLTGPGTTASGTRERGRL